MITLKKSGFSLLGLAVAMLLGGCFADSIQPWLDAASIRERELDFEGDWVIVNDDYMDKYLVTLEKKKDPRTINQQSYYVKVSPLKYENRFHFSGVVHEINSIKLAQITNFSHYHDDVISLAYRPTVSLWQIAYDQDNIILWAPGFVGEGISTVQTMQDSDDKLLFVDTTNNLQKLVNDWIEGYSQIKEEIRHIMPIALTRQGTGFVMPEEMEDLVPLVYERFRKKLD